MLGLLLGLLSGNEWAGCPNASAQVTCTMWHAARNARKKGTISNPNLSYTSLVDCLPLSSLLSSDPLSPSSRLVVSPLSTCTWQHSDHDLCRATQAQGQRVLQEEEIRRCHPRILDRYRTWAPLSVLLSREPTTAPCLSSSHIPNPRPSFFVVGQGSPSSRLLLQPSQLQSQGEAHGLTTEYQ